MPIQTDGSGRSVVPIWIDGEAIPLEPHSKIFPVTNSLANREVHRAHSVTESTATAACEAAWKAFQSWKKSAPATRRNLLLKVADVLERRRDDLIKSQIEETSCDDEWAATNLQITLGYVREIAACVSSVMGQIPMNDKPGTMSFVFREPIGPVLTIPPWNAAVVLCTRALCTAIGAGCTVVLKASELSPLTHHHIVSAFHEAGVPPGVLNQIQATRDDAARITEHLIASPQIRKIEFIGSAAVGRIIGSVAARYLKPVLMELGGKCPAIVLEDADLPKAAMLCVKGATLHHGQICFSTERILVHASILDQFVILLRSTFSSPEKIPPNGAAVHAGIAQKGHDLLSAAKSAGATFLVDPDHSPSYTDTNSAQGEGGSALGVKPNIILSSSHSTDLTDTESFTPTALLIPFSGDAEAVRLANSSSYGLNATIHTRDLARALRMARELEYGQVHVNAVSVYVSPTGSQGGVKGSGWGRQNAGWGLNEFLVEKFVSWHGDEGEEQLNWTTGD